MTAIEETYAPLRPQLMWQLAAPQTWAATIAALIFTFGFAVAKCPTSINILAAIVLSLVCFLMQAAANVFNDYFDYKKGTDTVENSSDDKFDAVLVYNKVKPGSVLAFAISLLVIAAIGGAYIVFISGLIPLAIGLIGALVVVFYSVGKTPISYLPIGEVVIGFVMGGLIPLACVTVLFGQFEPIVLLFSIPVMIGIGMILATNNTCDIEKDSETDRKTLALMLGRSHAVFFYRACAVVWLGSIVAISVFAAPGGIVFAALALLAAYPTYRVMFKNPLNAATRDASMAQITTLNVLLTALYAAVLLSGSIAVWVF